MAKPDTTKIALVQMRCGAEPERNFARAVEFIRDAAKQGAKITRISNWLRKYPEDRHLHWEMSRGKMAS